MPFEHRLHPSSILFAFAGILRMFALPLLLLIVTGVGGSSDNPDGWQMWMLFVLVFGVGSAVLRYLTFRLTYEGDELVIRSGILFRNERHVPYHRIQNLDATRGVAHRLFGVAEVHVETGSGQQAEARKAMPYGFMPPQNLTGSLDVLLYPIAASVVKKLY